ncbi:hypothetical protein OSB04_004145 [Centaurea solstitialis]|uniref:Potassium channel domain-containing protein n=1 Tax=Centaurea solstitialis TaxID=347529 RepID=A0AA38TY04_9ASTR|nr:hypothetical protein OSB04_004145 [Centaurea solstitialis]
MVWWWQPAAVVVVVVVAAADCKGYGGGGGGGRRVWVVVGGEKGLVTNDAQGTTIESDGGNQAPRPSFRTISIPSSNREKNMAEYFPWIQTSYLREIIVILSIYLGAGTTCFYLVRHHISGTKTNGVLDGLFFTLVIATSVGYGDLSPNSVLAILLSSLFSIMGMFLLTLVLSMGAMVLVKQQLHKIGPETTALLRKHKESNEVTNKIIMIFIWLLGQLSCFPSRIWTRGVNESSRARARQGSSSARDFMLEKLDKNSSRTLKSSSSNSLNIRARFLGLSSSSNSIKFDSNEPRSSSSSSYSIKARLVYTPNLDFIHTFYCITVTITSASSDKCFKTEGGRILALFWIIIGTIYKGHVLFTFTELYTKKTQGRFVKRKITTSRADLEAADIDGDGVIGPAEYILHKLRENGKFRKEDVVPIIEKFQRLNVDNTSLYLEELIEMGMLSKRTLSSYYGRVLKTRRSLMAPVGMSIDPVHPLHFVSQEEFMFPVRKVDLLKLQGELQDMLIPKGMKFLARGALLIKSRLSGGGDGLAEAICLSSFSAVKKKGRVFISISITIVLILNTIHILNRFLLGSLTTGVHRAAMVSNGGNQISSTRSLKHSDSRRAIYTKCDLFMVIGCLIYVGVAMISFYGIRNHISGTKTNSFLDSIYFTVVLMTSAGYKDLQPHRTLALLLATSFALMGILIFGVMMSLLANYFLSMQMGKKDFLASVLDNKTVQYPSGQKMKWKVLGVVLAVHTFIGTPLFIVIGNMHFFRALRCVSSTFTTVSSDEECFSTKDRRIFAVIWILFGMITLSGMIYVVTETYHHRRKWSVAKKDKNLVDLRPDDLNDKGFITVTARPTSVGEGNEALLIRCVDTSPGETRFGL